MMEGIEGFKGLRGFSRGGSAVGRGGSAAGRGGSALSRGRAGLSRGRSALSRGKDKVKGFFSSGKDKIKRIFSRRRRPESSGSGTSEVAKQKSSKAERIAAVGGLALGAGSLFSLLNSGDDEVQQQAANNPYDYQNYYDYSG